jgi:hypothetical protein
MEIQLKANKMKPQLTSIALALVISGCSDEPSKVNVSTMAHQCVATQLRSPSTAEFSNFGQEAIIQLNDSTWMVDGHVDAENAFGASMRSQFVCVITYRGDVVFCNDVLVF